jgi:hypothetical protein
MTHTNGMRSTAARARQFIAIATAGSMIIGGALWAQSRLVITPAVDAAKQVVRDETSKLSDQIYAEGVIRDVADSLLLVRINRLEVTSRGGVYTKHEVDKMRDTLLAAIHRIGKKNPK